MYINLHYMSISVGKHIDLFLDCFRLIFPHERITPKMHILDDHSVPQMTTWHCSLGLHAEHGAESIHNIFNSLERSYSNIKNPAQKLKAMLKEHALQTCSHAAKERPLIQHRSTAN